MKLNQILFDKYGNQMTVNSIKGKEYTGILMYRATYATGTGLTRAKATSQEVSFTDESLGVDYFFALDHIGNRDILFDEAGPYYFNRKNIKQKYEEYMVSLKSSLPYGVWLENQEDYQDVIDSFYDTEQRQEDEQFIGFHSSCFGRLDLDSEFLVGHDVKYFDEHFHDRLYISKGRYQKIENVQIINWRAEIATLYYEKSKLTHKSLRYADVFSKEQYEGVLGVEYKYQVMLRRAYITDPFSMQDTYICGTPRKKEVDTDEAIEDIQNLYKEGGVDPFLLKVLEEKRLESKLTDIIASIQSNQNAMIRHTDKLNMIVQGCAGSGKTMILLHRISYLMYNQKLRNVNRAAIIVPNSKFSIFIDELSGNLDIDQIPRYTMSQYYLKLILEYQSRIYRNAGGTDRQLISVMQQLEKTGFVHTNVTTAEEVFDDAFEFDTCEFYDKWMENFFKDISEEDILRIASDIGVEVKEVQINEGRLNRDFSLLSKIQSYLEENTENERLQLDKAKNKVNNLRIPERHVSGLCRRIKELFKEFNIGPSYSLSFLLRTLNGRAEIEQELIRLKEKQEELEKQAKSENRGFLRFVSGSTETKQKLDELAMRIEEIEKELVDKEDISEPDKLTDIRKEIERFKRWRQASLSFDTTRKVLAEYDEIVETLFNEDVSVETIREKLTDMVNRYKDSEEVIKASEELAVAETVYKSACEELISEDDRKIVEIATEKLSGRDAIIKTIFEKYRGIKFEEIQSSRDLFVLMAFYFLHVGKITIDKDFLFIDEAQDYSEIEYRLLKGLHDDKTIFELYGDCMQNVTPNRGITDWNQVKALMGDEYYELKENYRNTVEVADYVNDNIKQVFRTIGLHGDEVCEQLGEEWNEKAIDDIADSDKRTAIICRSRSVLAEYDLSGINTSNIYTVLDAKGLEFETVYVLDRDMTDNEKYISYSRALRNLYVIH